MTSAKKTSNNTKMYTKNYAETAVEPPPPQKKTSSAEIESLESFWQLSAVAVVPLPFFSQFLNVNYKATAI